MARFGPPSAFANKLILRNNQYRSFLTYFLWLLCATRTEVSRCEDGFAHKAENIYYLSTTLEKAFTDLCHVPPLVLSICLSSVQVSAVDFPRVSGSFVTLRMRPKAHLEGFVSVSAAASHSLCPAVSHSAP